MPDTLTQSTDTLNAELVPPSDPRAGVISINPARVSGVPCFAGTRVPIQILWDYLEDGNDLAQFLDDYEGVPRGEAVAALKLAFERLLCDLPGKPWR